MIVTNTLVSIGALAAASGAFHLAAFDASYEMLVPDRLSPRANGMMQTTWSISGIVSPALAAFIIALPTFLPREVGAAIPAAAMGGGTPLVIAIDALTFFLSTAVLLLVHVPSSAPTFLTVVGRDVLGREPGPRPGRGHRALTRQVQPRGRSGSARLHIRNRPCPAWRRCWRGRDHRWPAGHRLGRVEAEACLWRPRPDAAGGRSLDSVSAPM
jgi:hypothetical protein